jgi:membrane protease subunit (stomatin/prohibitin family)
MAVLDLLEFFDPTGELIVSKLPPNGSDEIRLGSQLVVQESQIAIFHKDGRALDHFGPGRHTLTTLNLPLLGRLIGAPFGGRSPFRAYVYFVSTKTFTNLGWGTPSPVVFRDTEFRWVQLRAHGAFSIRITEPTLFMQTLVGTKGMEYTMQIQEYLRSIIVSRLNEVLGQQMKSVLDLATQYSAIALGVKQATRADLAQYGIELVDLIVEAITPPPDIQERLNKATGVAAQDTEKYRQIALSDAMLEAARNPSGAGEGVGIGLGVGMGRQMADMIAPAAPAAPAPQPGGGMDPEVLRAKMRQLKGLMEDGLITEAEFNEQKKRLLEQI